MQQESILHRLLTRPAVARPSAEAAPPPGASAAPKRPRSPEDAAPRATAAPKRQCASASESTAPAEEPGGRAVAGTQERLPADVEPQEGPGALGGSGWRGPATPCSTPSGLVDEDCEDNGRDRPESPPFTQLPTEAPLGNSQPHVPSTQEDTSSTREDLDQEDEATPTTFSQDGAVAPWELGPWVMRAPRTPSYTPPPPPLPLPPPPPPPGCMGSVATPTAGVEAFVMTPADPYPPPLPPLPPPPPPPPPPSPPPPDVESASQHPPSIRGSVLYGAAAHYVVLGTFGQGVYGQVLHCREIATGRSRAIKVLRLEGQWSAAARNEARALARISLNDPDLHNLVRLYEAFERNNYLFLVLEALDVDLAAFMSTQNEQPLRMDAIAAILKQLFCALRKLEELDIIHADVKPSNIMLKPHPAARWRVKLVDFSNALSAKRALRAPSAQTICYRAPEVALGQAFCAAADVWSLGCVAAELATAAPLYRHARCDATLLHAVTRTHGPLPRALLARPGRTECFYTQDARGGWTLRELDTPNLFTWFTSLDDVCIYHISRLSEEEKLFFSVEIVLFRDLLRKMLDIYQETRLNPKEALSHIFLCGEYANYS